MQNSCAGLCEWKSRGFLYEVEIKLSEPLLKFRPMSDLIDTLLHEMIHAYLLITDKRASREDHGPLFQEQMNRVNRIAGTRITIYHSFFDEVNYYKTHWWQCSSCSKIIKRSMNRAPSKNDNWFASHESKCGGSFIKIKEPDGFKSRSKKSDQIKKLPPNQPDITKFFPGLGKRIGTSDLPLKTPNVKKQKIDVK